MKNRNSPDIDAIAGPFAIEHTSIDTLPNQRRNADWFSKVTEGLEEEFSDRLSFRLSITFDYAAITKDYVAIEKRDLGEIHGTFKNLISEAKLSLADGCHVLNDVPNIPFLFHVVKVSELPEDILFPLVAPDSHQNVPVTPEEAAELIIFAGHLLRIIDSRAPTSTDL